VTVRFGHPTPIFRVAVACSCNLFLASEDQGHPGAWIWVGVGDAGGCQRAG